MDEDRWLTPATEHVVLVRLASVALRAASPRRALIGCELISELIMSIAALSVLIRRNTNLFESSSLRTRLCWIVCLCMSMQMSRVP
jgi:hypothetical protein